MKTIDASDLLIHVGPACHDEVLDPGRRYGVFEYKRAFSVADWTSPQTLPRRLPFDGEEVVALLGNGALWAFLDGDRVCVAGADGKLVRAWTSLIDGDDTVRASFSPDGKSLWVCCEGSQQLYLLDLDSAAVPDPFCLERADEQVATLWVHPQRPLLVVDSFQPQDFSRFVVVERGEDRLRATACELELDTIGEFVGFDREGDGVFATADEIGRWSLTTGRTKGEVTAARLAADIFEDDEPRFQPRASAFGGMVAAALLNAADQRRICLLHDSLELAAVLDPGGENEPYGAELLAGGILRVPYFDYTNYYRLPPLR